MKNKIESVKSVMESMDESYFEVVAALERLDEEMASTLLYPGITKVEKTIDATMEHVENDKVDQAVITLWRKLVDEVKEWESEHPRITKVIGDIAQGLANAGI